MDTDKTDSQVYTKKEVREQFLDVVRNYAQYWASFPDRTAQERCDGLAFSLMNIFDGTSAALPAFDIVARPHPDDKDYRIGQGQNYIEDGLVLNDDCLLHELYYPH